MAADRHHPPAAAGRRCADGPILGDGVVVPMRRPGWSWSQRSLGIAAAVLAVLALSLSTLLVQSNSARTRIDATQAAVTRVLTAGDAVVTSGTMGGAAR